MATQALLLLFPLLLPLLLLSILLRQQPQPAK
jgi:hypothetical protein